MRASWWTAVLAAALVAAGAPRTASAASPAQRADGSTTASPTAATTAAPTTAPATPTGGPQYRLPETAIPLEYTISLHLDKPTPKAYEGTVTIDVVAVRAVSFITLHSAGLAITKATYAEEPNFEEIAVTGTLDSTLQTVTFPLSAPLTPGEKYRLKISFSGTLREDMYGFYSSTYTRADGTTVRLAATQFEPAYARWAFPCWDEPHYKAKFQVSISYPNENGWTAALSNTPSDKSGPQTGDSTRTLTTFKKTPTMSSYLVAFVVSDFASTDGATSDSSALPYRVWVRPEQTEQAKYAAQVGPQLLAQLEKLVGITYSKMGLGKLDLIAIPDFAAGAMENWGLITYRETGIMFTEGESTEAARESIALVIAHEQAHMWFGDLVSPAWWRCLWLNEGFARYFQYVSLAGVKTDWRLMDSFVVRTLQGALAYDAVASSRALTSEVYTPDEIQAKFDRISYDKGASVLHMTRNVMGDDNFYLALNKYLTEMQSWTANPHDLFRAFDAVLKTPVKTPPQPPPKGVTLTDVLETWTQQAGYPVVTIRAVAAGDAEVSQVRFLSSGSAASAATAAQRWWVPLTYQWQDAAAATAWLEPTKNTTIPKETDKWIIANVQQTGFYRVNYDDDNWGRLAKYLQADDNKQISVLNRAQILDDALSLARAGVLAYPVALETTRYLAKETDPVPWTSVFSHLGFLGKMLVGDEAQATFKAYMLGLMDRAYEDVGFDEPTTEAADDTKHLRLVFRSTLMGQACGLGHEGCVGNATALFAAFKAGTKAVPPSLRSTVYCAGLRNGSTADWEWMWQRFTATTTAPGEKSLILGALGCTRDTATLTKYLQSSTDSAQVRAQDATSVFAAVLSGGDNLDLAFKFFQDNFEKMQKNYRGWSSMQKVIEGLADRILTTDKLTELDKFLSTNSAKLGVPQATVERSLEAARANIAWRDKHLSAVSKWVRGDRSTSGAAALTSQILPAALAVLALLQGLRG